MDRQVERLQTASEPLAVQPPSRRRYEAGRPRLIDVIS
jgi:hypothetical protein